MIHTQCQTDIIKFMQTIDKANGIAKGDLVFFAKLGQVEDLNAELGPLIIAGEIETKFRDEELWIRGLK